jgi:2'-5' RNA ligase
VTSFFPDSLFFAIRPDERTATSISDSGALLRALCRLRSKLIAPERLHITLHFVGDFDAGVAERAVEAVRSLRAEPFDIILDRAMSFANRREKRPFVLLAAPSQELKSLQKKIVATLMQAGFSNELRGFTPHLTLLYDEQVVKERSISPISWAVREFVLVRSFVGRSRHETLGRWPLMGTDCGGAVARRVLSLTASR